MYGMRHFEQLRVAYLVASCGSVSAASQLLDVHRSTIQRKIENLEAALGQQLFHRHVKGYTPTEFGEVLLKSAKELEAKYNETIGRLKNHDFQLSNDLTISSPGPLAPLIMKAGDAFREAYPDCQLRLQVTEDLPVLEYREVDIALCVDERPEIDDYVFVPLFEAVSGPYASRSYIEEFGEPKTVEALNGHRLINAVNAEIAPPCVWFEKFLSDAGISKNDMVLLSDCHATRFRAVIDGAGIGILPAFLGEAEPNMTRILPQITCPVSPIIYSITHSAVHRTNKIQKFLQCLRETIDYINKAPDHARRVVAY